MKSSDAGTAALVNPLWGAHSATSNSRAVLQQKQQGLRRTCVPPPPPPSPAASRRRVGRQPSAAAARVVAAILRVTVAARGRCGHRYSGATCRAGKKAAANSHDMLSVPGTRSGAPMGRSSPPAACAISAWQPSRLPHTLVHPAALLVVRDQFLCHLDQLRTPLGELQSVEHELGPPGARRRSQRCPSALNKVAMGSK